MLNRLDLLAVFTRLLFVQGLLHQKGMQNLGFFSALSPALDKLGRMMPEDQRNSLFEHHLEFFNCNPNFTPLIAGGVLRMEEQRLSGSGVTVADITYFKRAMSSPLAAMGDLLFLGALKPLALTLACIFAIYNSLIGLLAILLLYNATVITCRLWGIYFGYSKGWELVDVFSGPTFQRLLGVFQSIGACAGGALVAVVLFRLQLGGVWLGVVGAAVLFAVVFLLRRDVSSSRFAIFLFPLSVIIALLLS